MTYRLKLSRRNRCIFLSFAFILVSSLTATSQGKIRTGTVFDSNEQVLPGTTVLIKGKSKGTQTDFEGSFQIKAEDSDVLEFSYLGFQSHTVTVGTTNEFKIYLKEQSNKLDEIVVVGYGTERKSDLSGAMSRVKAVGVSNKPYTNIDQLLQGKAAGVRINLNSGAPGAASEINIRGVNTLNGSTQPLYVIDGVEVLYENTVAEGMDGSSQQPPMNPLATINPNDIESIEVLKDASATAIYGSRGANGVIMITTKIGKGAGKISYKVRADISQLPKQLSVLNTRDYLTMRNEGLDARENGILEKFTPVQIDSVVNSRGNINWQEQIYRQALSQDHNLTFSGSGDLSDYLVSLGYQDIEGIVINSGMQRYTFRTNVSRKIKKWLKITTNLNYSRLESSQANHSSPYGTPNSSAVLAALFTEPFYRTDLFVDDGTIVDNPVTVASKMSNDYLTETFVGRFAYDARLLKGLSFRGNFNANSYKSSRQTYAPRGTNTGDAAGGLAAMGLVDNFNFGVENVLAYNGKLTKKTRVNAVLGSTYREGHMKSLKTEASGFLNDELLYNNLASAEVVGRVYNTYVVTKLLSFFSRANFVYDNKYILTLTGRYDGSSRLQQKWSFFPSGAFAWNISKEDFFKELFTYSVTNFKLRTSYGVTGNQAVRPLASQSTFGTVTSVVGEGFTTGVLASSHNTNQGQLGNPNLTWEKTAQFNIGLDLGFVKNRYRISLDWFHKNTTDLLINLPLADSNAYESYWTNQGELENTGFEIELGADVIDTEFKWDINATFSAIDNKIISLGAIEGGLFGKTWINSGGVTLNQPLHYSVVGGQVGTFYGYRHDGIYQNQEEVDTSPRIAGVTPKPGDHKYRDLNGDGVINGDDQEVIGSAIPDFSFGVQNSFSYKNISLNLAIVGNMGSEIYNLNRYIGDGMAVENRRNAFQSAYNNRWTGEGTSNTYGRVRPDGNLFETLPSDYFIEDASFIRLKDVTLAYNIPLKSKSVLKNVKIFATGTNLYVWTNYSGYDPEGRISKSPLEPGVDFGVFPQTRIYSFGANIDF